MEGERKEREREKKGGERKKEKGIRGRNCDFMFYF